ncbi:MAG TPA: molybdopterin-binding protein [Anaerolineaceae bacterium]
MFKVYTNPSWMYNRSIHMFGKEIKDMKLSARNILKGKVVKIVRGAVNAEVTIQLPGGEQVVSIITIGSVESLGLKEGKEAYAVIKASSVMIAVD